MEGTVFDFHTDHARKLRSFPQPSGYAVGKGKKAAAGLGSVGYVFGQCDGITDAFCLGGGGSDNGFINAVGIFPKKQAVAF